MLRAASALRSFALRRGGPPPMGSFRRVRCARDRWPTSRLREHKGGPPMPTTKRPGTRMTRTAGSARLVLLVSTRKGAWLFHGDGARRSWRVDGPHFLGQVINHLVLDPRDGRTLLAAAKTGHLGPTVFRSTDLGRSWKEAKRPPAFAKAPESERGRAVDHTFLAHPRSRDRVGDVVRGYLAPRPLPVRRRRRHVAAGLRVERRSSVQGVGGG